MKISLAHLSRIGKWSKQFSNLPDRYINRAMNQVYWRNPKGIQYKPNAVMQRKKFNFSVHRPWSQQFLNDNQARTHSPKVFVEPIKEWSFFRGDRVEVLVGKMILLFLVFDALSKLSQLQVKIRVNKDS